MADIVKKREIVGLAIGYWSDFDDLGQNWRMDKTWKPQMDKVERQRGIKGRF